jgi:ATP-dependent Lon protease
MRDFRDAKAMAQTLRDALKSKSISLTHSESLELIAKILGFHDWNVLSAKIVQSEGDQTLIKLSADHDRPVLALPAGADLPVVPMRDFVLFPQMISPIYIGREKSKRALDCAMEGDKRIVVVTQRRAGDDDPTQEALYGVGVIATVLELVPLLDGTVRGLVRCLERVTLARLVEGEMLGAKVAPFTESRGDEVQAAALTRAVLERFQAYLNISYATWPYRNLKDIREPGMLADAIVPLMPPIEINKRQELLETGDGVARLEKILELMKDDRHAA